MVGKKEIMDLENTGTRGTTREDSELGARMRRARMGKSMSLTSLSGKLGISPQQLQKYENGKNRIPALRLRDVAVILGVSINELLGEEE